MEIHRLFAHLCWFLLIAILWSRPLADILGWKILRWVVSKRKILGIACGIAGILHAGIYLIGTGRLSVYFTDPFFWTPGNYLGWGSLALAAMMLPFVTSNRFSQRMLRRNWKKVQRLSYLAFVLAGVHIGAIHGEWASGLAPVAIWAVLWLAARKKGRSRILARKAAMA